MAVRILDYQAVQPRSTTSTRTLNIPNSPRRLRLAAISLRVPRATNRQTRVELLATVGVKGVTNIAQLVFRVFRDGTEIFSTQQGVESTGSEQFYTVAFQAIDLNAGSGSHRYTLTVENATANATAQVVGPVNFSGKVIKRK